MTRGLSAAQRRKSSHSGDTGGQRVEAAALPGQIDIRDSKNPEAPHLTFGSGRPGQAPSSTG
ncbi:DUF397 domain-containing protein [Actinocorallia sp. B10E7]|uniref:DUF397 domain-containing protein n=1 Tax=Actinocorallia sp. B10E7 TaxID=3153558 RepID=UPI00325F8F92